MKHQLKIKPEYYERIKDGSKTCEIRFNDRDYHRGDVICFDVLEYEITDVLRFPEGLKDGFVALSIKLIE